MRPFKVRWLETSYGGTNEWELFTAWRDEEEVSMGAQVLLVSEGIAHDVPRARFTLRLRRMTGTARRRTRVWEAPFLTFAAAVTEAEAALKSLELPDTEGLT